MVIYKIGRAYSGNYSALVVKELDDIWTTPYYYGLKENLKTCEKADHWKLNSAATLKNIWNIFF